jgi:hypothetical protein
MERRRIRSSLVAVASALTLASTGTLLANGQTFFVPAGTGPVNLAYFARVKDSRTGRPIPSTPQVTIVDANSGIYIPFDGDGPAHFRSPDIGMAIKELSNQPVDPSQLEIRVMAPGYRSVKIERVPRQSKGIIELTVRMEPTDAPGESTAAATRAGAMGAGTSAPKDSSKPTFFLLAACFGLAVISAVARTVARPDSTER